MTGRQVSVVDGTRGPRVRQPNGHRIFTMTIYIRFDSDVESASCSSNWLRKAALISHVDLHDVGQHVDTSFLYNFPPQMD